MAQGTKPTFEVCLFLFHFLFPFFLFSFSFFLYFLCPFTTSFLAFEALEFLFCSYFIQACLQTHNTHVLLFFCPLFVYCLLSFFLLLSPSLSPFLLFFFSNEKKTTKNWMVPFLSLFGVPFFSYFFFQVCLQTHNTPQITLPVISFTGVQTLSVYIVDNLGDEPVTHVTKFDIFGVKP